MIQQLGILHTGLTYRVQQMGFDRQEQAHRILLTGPIQNEQQIESCGHCDKKRALLKGGLSSMAQETEFRRQGVKENNYVPFGLTSRGGQCQLGLSSQQDLAGEIQLTGRIGIYPCGTILVIIFMHTNPPPAPPVGYFSHDTLHFLIRLCSFSRWYR